MKKILLSWVVLLWFTTVALAFDANLSVDKTQADINTPINLTIKINNDKQSDVKITEIKWLENFDIVWQRQFQSSSSQITIINWQTKSITTVNHTLILSLQAKKAWSYTIWPAILQVWNQTYKTNQVDVKITGAKIMINNAQNSIQQLQQQNTQQIPQAPPSWNIKNNTQSQQLENIQSQKLENNSDYFILIIWLLLLIWAGILIYASKKKDNEELSENLEWWDNDSEWNNIITDNQNKITDDSQPLAGTAEGSNSLWLEKDNLWLNNENKSSSPISFLSKYWIDNPETKSYSEIINELNKKWIELSEEEIKIIEDELLNKFIKFS